ncbi:Hypothetical predicted protein [Podarcis lilfordi]|uniref:Uncharacterized protein n=1 Tax=Podarcis lilfordi TaxID=74358 RepID=A0AA35LIG5_9SAUR|nr:Hypothetical predicted protein [Podarcis lilfordi]
MTSKWERKPRLLQQTTERGDKNENEQPSLCSCDFYDGLLMQNPVCIIPARQLISNCCLSHLLILPNMTLY